MDYLCKHVKQIAIETHPKYALFSKSIKIPPGVNFEYVKQLRKLEKCFLLFHRDTRFFSESLFVHGFLKTEFQEPKNFAIDLKNYRDENDLIDYLVTFGEMSFINANFLN